jgi:hypothetical protein
MANLKPYLLILILVIDVFYRHEAAFAANGWRWSIHLTESHPAVFEVPVREANRAYDPQVDSSTHHDRTGIRPDGVVTLNRDKTRFMTGHLAGERFWTKDRLCPVVQGRRHGKPSAPKESIFCFSDGGLRRSDVNNHEACFDSAFRLEQIPRWRPGYGDTANFYSWRMFSQVLFPLEAVLFYRKIGLLSGQQELLFFKVNGLFSECACQSQFRRLFMGGSGQFISGFGESIGGTIQKVRHVSDQNGDGQSPNGSEGFNGLPVLSRPCPHCEEDGRLIIFGGLAILVLFCGAAWLGYRQGRRGRNAQGGHS